jgi:hypothetical protein
MKIFEEKYAPIEITVKNIQDKEFILKTLFQTSEMTDKVELLLQDGKITNTDKIHQMMILMFGKDKNFWKQFSIDLLSQIADFIREEGKKKEEKTTG